MYLLSDKIFVHRRWMSVQRRWTAVQRRWTAVQRRWTEISSGCKDNYIWYKQQI